MSNSCSGPEYHGHVGIGTTSPSATLQVNGTLAATNLPQLTSLGVARGTVTCNDAVQAQTAMNFTGNAGQKVDILVSNNLRLNTSGYHYVDLYLDGTRVDSAGTFSNSGWRSQTTTVYNGVLSTSGTHTLQAKITCGSSATSGSDTGGEWPNGGLHYRVWVGG